MAYSQQEASYLTTQPPPSPNDTSFTSHTPTAPELTSSEARQLAHLGLSLDKPLFRISQVYKSTSILCQNCDQEKKSEELVIRPLSLTIEQYQHLIDNGWYRRGGVKMFRFRSNHTVECCKWQVRVLVDKFDHQKHKSYKKVLRRMPVDRLTVETVPTSFNREAFNLYNSYNAKKHNKPFKSEQSYCEHVVNTPITIQNVNGVDCGTFHQHYRLDGVLVAVGVIDVVPEGVISIYMWYDVTKEIAKYSFGVYSSLKEIELVKELAKKNPLIKYYYLEGWNPNNRKYSYKANYEPGDFYCPGVALGWVFSLEGVSDAKKKAERENEATAMISQTLVEGAEGGEMVSLEDKKLPQQKNSDTSGKDAVSEKAKIQYTAYTLDNQRLEQDSGGSPVNVGKTIVSLHHSRFMLLEDLLERYQIHSSQREIMKARCGELLAALNPELRSQLVIDLATSSNFFFHS